MLTRLSFKYTFANIIYFLHPHSALSRVSKLCTTCYKALVVAYQQVYVLMEESGLLKPAGFTLSSVLSSTVFSVICFVALTTAAVCFINSNYSGSELTVFITLTAGLLDVQVCYYRSVYTCCMCVPTTEGNADEKASEAVKRVIY